MNYVIQSNSYQQIAERQLSVDGRREKIRIFNDYRVSYFQDRKILEISFKANEYA